MTENDETIEIVLDRARINMFRISKKYKKFKEIKSWEVRLVKY